MNLSVYDSSYFCWYLIRGAKSWKDPQEVVWSFPMQWDKINYTVAAPNMYFLKTPCACIASAWPLFHSPCTWKAFINIESKLILLPIISGPSKTHSGVVISPSLPQDYRLSARSPLMPVSQNSLVQLNRLTTSHRSCFPTLMSYGFHYCLICLHVSVSVASKTKARVPI